MPGMRPRPEARGEPPEGEHYGRGLPGARAPFSADDDLGLVFVANPVIGGALTMDNVTAQRAVIAAATGPVFAYCASGNRSSIVWALANAGKRPVDELVGLPARFGYQLDHLRPQIAALAQG